MSERPRSMADDDFPVRTTEFSGSTPAEDRWHDAVLAEVVDLGMDTKFGKPQHRGALVFQLDEIRRDGQFANRRKEAIFWFSFDWGLGSSEKGTKLRTLLEGWRGRPFSPAELARFKTEPLRLGKLVGRPVRIFTVAEKAKTSDKMVTKIMKAEPANQQTALAVSGDYVKWYDRGGDREKPTDHVEDDDSPFGPEPNDPLDSTDDEDIFG